MSQKTHYKHYIGLTSQISFCQVPLRLDAFNQCNFSCSYCFAKSRGGNRGSKKLQVTRTENLKDRFERIESGTIQSAVDEFIDRRIPIQFGGMTDPFSPLEKRSRTSLGILTLLASRNYPTLISTKSTIPSETSYAEALQSGNFLVRFSISAIPEHLRDKVEKGVPALKSTLAAIASLSARGVACSVRFQPVFPTYETLTFDLIAACKASGARHVTFEYLKLPIENLDEPICRLPTIDGRTMLTAYREAKAERQGRELVLPRAYKLSFLSEVSRFARGLGLTVGFGDNEFLPFSDGNSCCNGADLHLKNANYFDANVAGIIRNKGVGDKICFDDFSKKWMPQKSVETYLNSKNRLSTGQLKVTWLDMLEHHWRTESMYAPSYFFGVSPTDQIDQHGLPIFYRSRTEI
jgi:DNA repair photolyase